MITRNVELLGNSWTLIASSKRCLMSSTKAIYYLYADSSPSVDLLGHLLEKGSTLSNTSTSTNLYARAKDLGAIAIVTEEP